MGIFFFPEMEGFVLPWAWWGTREGERQETGQDLRALCGKWEDMLTRIMEKSMGGGDVTRALTCVGALVYRSKEWSLEWCLDCSGIDILPAGMEGNVLLCSCLKKKNFSTLQSQQNRTGPLLHFHPSLAQLMSLPYLAFVFFYTGQPQAFFISPFPRHPVPISLNYIGFSTWEFLTLYDEKTPSTKGNSICPQSLPYSPERIHFLSCFLSN